MYTVTRYEAELIRTYKEQLAVLKTLDHFTDEQRAHHINELTSAFIADMTNAI